MTGVVAPFPPARRAAPVRPRAERRDLTETLAFVAAVFLLLTFSEGWILPLTGGGDETADSGLIRTLYIPAYAVAVMLMALTPWRLFVGLIRQPFLIFLLGVASASIVWSVAPDQTSRRIFALLFTTLGGAALAARYSWARLAEALAWTFAILAVASLFFALFVPSIGRMTDTFPGAWRGLWMEKNALGGNMALGAAICCAAGLLSPRRRVWWWSVAGLCLVMVLMSTSKTALLSVLLGAGAVGLVWAVRRGATSSILATWVAVVVLGVVGAVAAFAPDVVFGLLGKDATLTGRTQIWAAVSHQIDSRPLLGFGYAAVWDETDYWGPLAWIIHDAGFRPHHSHNSWLEQWLGLGVVGLCAWSAFFAQTLVANIVALYRDKGAYLALPFFVIFALTTISESIVLQYNDMRWAIFVVLAVKLMLPDRAPVPAPAKAPVRPMLRPRAVGRAPSRSPSSP